MTPTTSEAKLTPELLDRVKQLSLESKAELLDLLLEEFGPPDDRTDDEIAAEIKRRSDEYYAGTVKSLTREESDALIRAEVRKLGVELP